MKQLTQQVASWSSWVKGLSKPYLAQHSYLCHLYSSLLTKTMSLSKIWDGKQELRSLLEADWFLYRNNGWLWKYFEQHHYSKRQKLRKGQGTHIPKLGVTRPNKSTDRSVEMLRGDKLGTETRAAGAEAEPMCGWRREISNSSTAVRGTCSPATCQPRRNSAICTLQSGSTRIGAPSKTASRIEGAGKWRRWTWTWRKNIT